MDLTAPALLFFSQYIYVFAKSNQQLNVVNFKWLRIIPMSYVMSGLHFFEFVIVVADVMEHGMWRILILMAFHGTGAWLGSWTGMWLYLKLRR